MDSYLKAMGWEKPCEVEVKEALSNLEIQYPHEIKQAVQSFYDKWSTYDWDCSKLQYAAPRTIAEEAAKLATNQEKKTWNVLDLGAGTGRVGEELRKQGFEGKITALDFSENMIERLSSHSHVYSTAIQHTVVPGHHLPFENSTFDLVCGSAFGVTEIQPESIKEVVHVLRPGGYFINSLIRTEATAEFKKKLIDCAQQEKDSKLIKEISCIEYDLYKWKIDDETHQTVPADLWVYKIC